MSKAQDTRIDEGAKLYDKFVATLNQEFQLEEKVATPRTNTLELFSVILGKGDMYRALLVAEMCREYAGNFKDNLHSNGNTIYRQINIKQKLA